MLSLLNRVLLPDHIRSRMPLRLINLISPSRSRLLELPMRGMDAEELARLGTVLVVAPHPDDESLGCGGLIALHTRARQSVHVLFVSDGSASHPNSSSFPPKELARLREREALAALRELGLDDSAATFLKLPDGRLPFPDDEGFPKAVAAVASFLRHADFDSILVPWRRDSINDHRATWHIVQTSLSAAMKTCRLFEYPIWAWTDDADVPSPDEVTVWRLDIKAARRAKSRATACHLSQVTDLIKDDPGRRLSRKFLASFDRPWEIFFEPTPRASPLVRRLPMEHEFRRDGGSTRGP
jgi:LmbE family N-acetylglucosaminyl deacetylase